jgi:hypothetical protein
MRRRSARPEDIIQRAVFKHLEVRAAPGVFAFHVPNGGKRKPIEAAILKGLGVKAGVPDVVACYRGQFYALELKAEGGRPSDKQLEAVESIRNAGGFACIAEGLDRALNCLETWGLLRGKAA